MKLSEILNLSSREELVLVSKILKKDLSWVLAHINEDIGNLEHVEDALKKLRSGYPLQYITREKEFMGLIFEIEEGVFIPRYETEDMVERAIEIIKKEGLKLVAEIGVGSGAIGVSIAKYTGVRIVGTDVSEKAVNLARRNAERHGVSGLFYVKLGEFLEPFEDLYDDIDMIISNPPYVEEDYEPPIDVSHEPREAIFSGDGFEFFRKFFKRYDISGKYVLMEFSGKRRDIIHEIAKRDVEFIEDINGVGRFFLIRPS